MRILLPLLLFSSLALAQNRSAVVNVTSDPSGACSPSNRPADPIEYNITNGSMWGCKAHVWTLITGAGGGGSVTTISGSGPSWLTWTIANPTTTPAITLSATTGQTSHRVIGTCNALTAFAPCALVAGDLPSTAVTPGSYTSTNLTVDQQGRITAAANGSAANPINVGTDENFYVQPHFAYSTGIAVSSVNDANSLNEPLEFRATSFDFTVGNVGIGVVNAGDALDVNGSAVFGASSASAFDAVRVAVISTQAATENVALNLINNNGSAGTGTAIDFTPNTNIALARITGLRTAVNGTTDFVFKNYNASALVETMRILGTTGLVTSTGWASNGTTFTTDAGCGTTTSKTGGSTAGRFAIAASGPCTVVITMGTGATASNGWACKASDRTLVADVPQSADSATTASIVIPVGGLSGDVISFQCEGY